MPGNKANLKTELQSIFESLDNDKTASDAASDIANAIDTYLGTITVASGIAVSTTGTATAQTGTTTETGTLQ